MAQQRGRAQERHAAEQRRRLACDEVGGGVECGCMTRPDRLLSWHEERRSMSDAKTLLLELLAVIRLHVPSIGLVVAGDTTYNGVHLLLAESPNSQKRHEWIAALDKIELLKPRAVIAGHKRPGNEDSAKILEETRQYIRDFDRIAQTTTTARELYDQMLRLHPLRMNVTSLWASSRALRPS
jgi:hypothetical protein